MLEEPSESITPAPLFTFPPIAGFWRRFLAWIIDVVILGVFGQIIGFAFSFILFHIGPYARPIGLLFSVPYFGIMDSKMGGGQTFGKRLMKIAVRDQHNEPIALWRAVARFLVLALPTLFNGWSLPIFQKPVFAWFGTFVVFGLGGAILYTMLFNRKARQGIHDLLLGTYVVYLPGNPIKSFPPTPRIHKIVSLVWISVVAIGAFVLAFTTPSLVSDTPLAPVMQLHERLQDDPRFFTVSLTDNTVHSPNGETRRFLIISVWYDGKPDEKERQKVMNDLVTNVFENFPEIDRYDGIQVKIMAAYDIGIAKAHITHSFGDTIEGWRNRIDFNQ